MSIIRNKVDLTIPPEQVGNITASLDLLESSMPALSALSNLERRSIVRMGDKSVSFVTQACQLLRDQPDIFPAGLKPEDIERDAEVRAVLASVINRLKALLRLAEDTYMLAGSDMMQASMVVYRCLRSHGELSGLQDVTEQLGRRFERPARKTAPTPPAEAQSQSPAPSGDVKPPIVQVGEPQRQHRNRRAPATENESIQPTWQTPTERQPNGFRADDPPHLAPGGDS